MRLDSSTVRLSFIFNALSDSAALLPFARVASPRTYDLGRRPSFFVLSPQKAGATGLSFDIEIHSNLSEWRAMGAEGTYRYEATTVEGFVQQLAVCYFRNRYWFYVFGEIPPEKDASKVDEKLLTRYEVEQSKWAKARARRRGHAKVQYLRYQTTFVIVATEGAHIFFDEEKGNIRDARERPVKFYGYSIGYKDGHPYVRIGTAQYRELVEAFLNSALTSSGETLASRFKALPFEPYGPVKVQLRRLLQRVNEVRRAAGLSRIDPGVLLTKRRAVRPFAPITNEPQPSRQHGPPNAGAMQSRRG